ncbi:hypothetical protein MNBD_GAMMA04-112, partial [hydrothermal vent metagenome]
MTEKNSSSSSHNTQISLLKGMFRSAYKL